MSINFLLMANYVFQKAQQQYSSCSEVRHSLQLLLFFLLFHNNLQHFSIILQVQIFQLITKIKLSYPLLLKNFWNYFQKIFQTFIIFSFIKRITVPFIVFCQLIIMCSFSILFSITIICSKLIIITLQNLIKTSTFFYHLRN